MSGLSAARIPPRPEVWCQRKMPLAASASKVWAGAMIVVDTADGYFKIAANGTTFRAVGIATETVDNSAGAAGALSVNVEFFRPIHGRWLLNDAGGGAAAQANVGSVCYLLDDQHVTMTTTTASKAGLIWAVATVDGVSQVFVEFPYPAIAG